MNDLNVDTRTARTVLVDSLQGRVPTWVVAQNILTLGVVPSDTKLFRELTELASSASWTERGGYGMGEEWDMVVPADSQLVTLGALFPTVDVNQVNGVKVDSSEYCDVLGKLVSDALLSLGIVVFTAADALKNRNVLVVPDGLGKNAFTKRLRFLARFEKKVTQLRAVVLNRHAQAQAKTRLAYMVDAQLLDDVTLAFVAYVVARGARRSLFMIGGQSKTFDNISEGLQSLLGENTCWDQVALVNPSRKILSHLSLDNLGRLTGIFHNEMVVAARELEKLWATLPVRMQEEMVMVKGVNSSWWNAFAGSFNSMRSAWINCMLVAGLDGTFEFYLPGKTVRLMASDLAWWHRDMGVELHEDTRMFHNLPYPWEVINGTEECNRNMILATAEAVKAVDTEKSGWVSSRAKVALEVAAPEPALVHGVVVGDPKLAEILRKNGAFSSKKYRDIFNDIDSIDVLETVTKINIVDGDKITPYVY